MSIPSDYTDYDIRDTFPRLTNLGASCLGEDVDMFGDTLTEALEDGPRSHNLPFKLQTISELKRLLAYSDADIERVSQDLLIMKPMVEPEAALN